VAGAAEEEVALTTVKTMLEEEAAAVALESV